MARVHTEEDLVESWVLDAVTGISDALIIVDASGRLAYCNPAATRLVGVGPLPLAEDTSQWSGDFGVCYPDECTPFPSDELPLRRALTGSEVRDVALFIRNR